MHQLSLLFALLFGLIFWGGPAEAASKISIKTERLIYKVARQEGVDPFLLRSMVAVESAFNPHSVSKKGAVGLMQLMPRTARELGVTNRYNPEQNLRGGARYLKRMLKRFSDVRLALAAYNAGPTAVSRFGGVPPYVETKKYVKNVLKNFAKFRPGGNVGPKRIYRYKKPNGTLVLTDKRRLLTTAASWKSSQPYRNSKNKPHISIKRHFSNKLKTVRMAPDIPAKPRMQSSRSMGPASTPLPTPQKRPIILASAQPQVAMPDKTLMVVRDKVGSIPIIRLSRQ
ncbi:MAG: lytic transglycosylase domain-containing protein [Magnetococcales bacterium]|nr:lytic transglycosylase domain-containing protein [Magnetococcales bacterium]